MTDEAPEPAKPTVKARWSRASRTEILLLGMTSALFLFTLFMSIRIWSGRSH